jgi:chromosome segregation ATPase
VQLQSKDDELEAQKEKFKAQENQLKDLDEQLKTKDVQLAKAKRDSENSAKMLESLSEESDKYYFQLRELMEEKKKLQEKVLRCSLSFLFLSFQLAH